MLIIGKYIESLYTETYLNNNKNMRRNNMWNRIFHNKEIKKNIAEYNKYLNWSKHGQAFIDVIKKADSLYTLLAIHKDAWGTGFQNENIGPCEYGMFRTKDISKMTAEEVYLGGIWGLFTYNIPFWEKRKDDKYGYNGFGIDENISLYKIILDQYKNILTSNIKAMMQQAKAELHLYAQAGYLK